MGFKVIFHLIGALFSIPIAWNIYSSIWNPPSKRYAIPNVRIASPKSQKSVQVQSKK